MVLDKLKLQLEAVLRVFNVTLPAASSSQPRPSGTADATASNVQPLEIGNELLITDDIIKLHKGLANSRGRVVIIDQLPANEYATIKASAFGIQVNVNVKAAQQMREAYIFREQTSTST
jgi:hypothetical protein